MRALGRQVTGACFWGMMENGREALPVGRLAFKAREGRQTVLSGFDSHSLPPFSLLVLYWGICATISLRLTCINALPGRAVMVTGN